MEGNGIFAQTHFVKNTPLCNYGGVQVTSNYAEKYLLPLKINVIMLSKYVKQQMMG